MPIDLNLRTWGDGPRRILLLHGIGSNAAGWWRLGPDLAEAGWAVTAPDLRGHGDSPSGGEPTLAACAADVLGLGGGWDVVQGHSLGGAVALVAHHSDPGWTRGLVLQDPALFIADQSYDEIIGHLLEPFHGSVNHEAVQRANPRWHAEDVRIKVDAMRSCTPETIEETMRANQPWNLLGSAATVGVPTVILGSDPEQGGIVSVAVGEWLAEQNRLIEYHKLENAGHSAHREVDMYQTFLGVVCRALDEVGRTDEGGS
jgi:pimeloyl-ACP methyl ester carboxylesterase